MKNLGKLALISAAISACEVPLREAEGLTQEDIRTVESYRSKFYKAVIDHTSLRTGTFKTPPQAEAVRKEAEDFLRNKGCEPAIHWYCEYDYQNALIMDAPRLTVCNHEPEKVVNKWFKADCSILKVED